MTSPGKSSRSYRVVLDDRTRSAHLAALIDARCNEPSRCPTVETVRKITRLFEVPAAELGAFFGLLLCGTGKREVWVDVVRSPHAAGWFRLSKCPPARLSR